MAFTTLLSVIGMLPAADLPSALPSALVSDPKAWVDVMPPADLKGWTRLAIPGTNALGRAQWHLDAERQLLICDGDGGHEMLRCGRGHKR